MSQINRREFIKLIAAASSAAVLTVPHSAWAGKAKARVVVIGGGYGGATAAKYTKLMDPAIEVTLIEPKTTYISCPFSDEVLVGVREMKTLERGYDGLKKRGVNVVHDYVTHVDPVKKTLSTKNGKKFDYDALVMSPGVDFHFDAIEGYSEALTQEIPYDYEAGPQTLLLRKQLEAMPDNGTFIIATPPKPFRCPPGPYERAAMVAYYCKTHGKTKAKILILDSNDSFSKKGLFEKAYKDLYGYGPGGMIEWIPAKDDGKVVKINAKTRTAYTTFAEHKADVLNVIPPHTAGAIATSTGLTNDKGWCEVVPMTMESAKAKDIYTIGDSCIAGELPVYDMPKSAHMAMTQAKVVAGAIVAKVNGNPPPVPYYANTCYSMVEPGYGFSVVHVFRVEDNKFVYVKEAGGISPVDKPATAGQPAVVVPRIQYTLEAAYGDGWLQNVLADAFD
jgi:sulfide dehydrogenase [flavocytochrome c] flavoprotein subunit